MQNRAYSILNAKKFEADDDYVTIEGVASTPTTDRVGDIVEPKGATFEKTIPLLWQHEHRSPIGEVQLGQPSADGIPFTARIPKIAEEGTLKQRVDEAIQSLKYQLVKAVSIGFRPLERGMEFMDEGGIRFTAYEIYELSAVTIPANSEALIGAIKSFDQHTGQPAASGPKAAREPAGDTAPQALPRRNTVKLHK